MVMILDGDVYMPPRNPVPEQEQQRQETQTASTMLAIRAAEGPGMMLFIDANKDKDKITIVTCKGEESMIMVRIMVRSMANKVWNKARNNDGYVKMEVKFAYDFINSVMADVFLPPPMVNIGTLMSSEDMVLEAVREMKDKAFMTILQNTSFTADQIRIAQDTIRREDADAAVMAPKTNEPVGRVIADGKMGMVYIPAGDKVPDGSGYKAEPERKLSVFGKLCKAWDNIGSKGSDGY